MRPLFYTILFLSLSAAVRAQSPALQIFPDSAHNRACPNVAITYYIFPWSLSCHVLGAVSGGEVLSQQFETGKMKVTIAWQEPIDPTSGRIEVLWADSTCGSITASKIWTVPLISSSTAPPLVYGADEYYMGQNNSVSLQADDQILATGGFIGAYYGTFVDFEWRTPDDWLVSIGSNSKNAFIYIPIANTLKEGCVQVRGRNACGKWSDWTDYCLHGTIPAPCPVNLAFSLQSCGDMSERIISTSPIIFPDSPQYNWAKPMYHWTVPPNWETLSANPSLQPVVLVRPDGQTNGKVSVFATAGDFTSKTCTLDLYFPPAHPLTAVQGPDYVCDTGDFTLFPFPSDIAEVSWQVFPLDPANPQVAVPDHGMGPATFQINDDQVSGYYRINFTVLTPCGTVTRRKDFFVGKPHFLNTTLDGAPFHAHAVCAGYHGTNTEVIGMSDPAVIWTASSDITGYTQRDSFVFSLTTGEASCPVVTASAGNVCGVRSLPLEMCLQPGCELPLVDLRVFPNPAYIIVLLEADSPDLATEKHGLIEKVEVFNRLGQLVATWQDPPNRRIVKSVAGFSDGLYTLRVTVWGQVITKQLMISHLF